MSTYLVNECPVDLPLDNPTAGDLKKHLGSPENSSVVVIWPNGRAQLLQDHESIPLHATNISIIPTDHESIILLPPPIPIPIVQAGEGKDGSPGEGEGGHPPVPVEISPTDVATIVASIAALAQVFLMIADMWSRRTKENKGSKKKQIPDRRQNEVEHIVVWMSNGNRVEFDSWRDEPEQVRDFIDVFSSPSASAKPEKVVFYLKTRSKIEVALSDTDTKGLDKLLHLLKQ